MYAKMRAHFLLQFSSEIKRNSEKRHHDYEVDKEE